MEWKTKQHFVCKSIPAHYGFLWLFCTTLCVNFVLTEQLSQTAPGNLNYFVYTVQRERLIACRLVDQKKFIRELFPNEVITSRWRTTIPTARMVHIRSREQIYSVTHPIKWMNELLTGILAGLLLCAADEWQRRRLNVVVSGSGFFLSRVSYSAIYIQRDIITILIHKWPRTGR